MFKCNKCGQHYIPGFLDCHCQIQLHQRQLTGKTLIASNTAPDLQLGAPPVRALLTSSEDKAIGSGLAPQAAQ